MPIWETALIFFFTTIIGLIAFYFLRPYLETLGYSEMRAYLISVLLAFLLMLLWSLVAFWKENGSFDWTDLTRRFRLGKPDRKIILWAIGLSIFTFGSELAFSPLLSALIKNGTIKIPSSIPGYIDPTVQLALSKIKAQFVAEGVLWLIPVVLFFNSVGEEFLWRGYVFPRQELAHGQYTWVLHGVLWGLSHAFQYWLLPSVMLVTLALSYLVQKRKNTWLGIIAHMINNGLPILILAFTV